MIIDKNKLYVNKIHKNNPFTYSNPEYWVCVKDIKPSFDGKDYWVMFSSSKTMLSSQFKEVFEDGTPPLRVILSYFIEVIRGRDKVTHLRVRDNHHIDYNKILTEFKSFIDNCDSSVLKIIEDYFCLPSLCKPSWESIEGVFHTNVTCNPLTVVESVDSIYV